MELESFKTWKEARISVQIKCLLKKCQKHPKQKEYNAPDGFYDPTWKGSKEKTIKFIYTVFSQLHFSQVAPSRS